MVYKPFIVLGLLVTILTGLISLWVMPESARSLRNLISQIRADVLTYIVAEGRFTSIDDGLTFHIRDRAADGTLVGLLVHDRRNPEEVMTYLAEEGRVVRAGESAYLVMDTGSMHQQEGTPEEITVIRFDRYVFDLSNLRVGSGKIEYRPRQMRMSELVNPSPDDTYYQQYPGKYRAEIHERFSSTLYPLAFVFISLATLGYPRTNRQGRGNSIVMAIVAVSVLRTVGFSATNLAVQEAWAVGLMYATPLIGIVGAAWIAFGQGRWLARIADSAPSLTIDPERLKPGAAWRSLKAAAKGAVGTLRQRFRPGGWGAAR